MRQIVACFFVFLAASASAFEAKVIAVADGDTITVLDADKSQHKIRLANIDAPERRQAFGNVAKDFLSSEVFGRQVRIEVKTVDRYGRKVANVFVGNRLVNFALVSSGYAWCYRQYLDEPLCLDLEQGAQVAGAGLWQDANPVPPWEFRRAKR